MDYTRFTFRAAVDFVEVLVRLSRPTQGRWIKQRTGVTYATPCSSQTGEPLEKRQHQTAVTTAFRIRIYDPARFEDVVAAVYAIGMKFQLSESPTVTALEVALDAYRKDGDSVALAELAALYVVRLKNLAAPFERRRVYRDGVGSAQAIPSTRQALVRYVLDGWQIGIGNPSDPESQHAYFKTTDHNGKPITDTSKHRARLETRQQGEALRDLRGIKTLESLRDFKFQNLSDRFYCRVISEDVTGLIRTILDIRTQNLSEPPLVSKRRRTFAVGTRADREFNKIVVKQLQNLTKRWRLHSGP
ncbi:MAG: hypothetical protein QM803_08900 [Rhodocyclaceae bacterium]